MKSPQINTPVEGSVALTAGAGEVPSIKIEDSVAMNLEDDAPSQMPPSTSTVSAFTAAVWNNDKRVNGLYGIADAHNSWMSIVGVGWVKLATSNDSTNEAMTILASHARVKNSQINYSVDAGLVNEMYVW